MFQRPELKHFNCYADYALAVIGYAALAADKGVLYTAVSGTRGDVSSPRGADCSPNSFSAESWARKDLGKGWSGRTSGADLRHASGGSGLCELRGGERTGVRDTAQGNTRGGGTAARTYAEVLRGVTPVSCDAAVCAPSRRKRRGSLASRERRKRRRREKKKGIHVPCGSPDVMSVDTMGSVCSTGENQGSIGVPSVVLGDIVVTDVPIVNVDLSDEFGSSFEPLDSVDDYLQFVDIDVQGCNDENLDDTFELSCAVTAVAPVIQKAVSYAMDGKYDVVDCGIMGMSQVVAAFELDATMDGESIAFLLNKYLEAGMIDAASLEKMFCSSNIVTDSACGSDYSEYEDTVD